MRISRRSFLKAGGAAAAVGTAVAHVPAAQAATAEAGRTNLPYQPKSLGPVAKLRTTRRRKRIKLEHRERKIHAPVANVCNIHSRNATMSARVSSSFR